MASAKITAMKRSTFVKLMAALFLVLLVVGFVLCELRWQWINDPQGKFTNIAEYLANGRLPGRVTKDRKEGQTFFIAYSPMDTWLAMPSGPAAYVFDESGTMIQWTRDIGDDPQFQGQWPLPQEESSLQELHQLETQHGVAGAT